MTKLKSVQIDTRDANVSVDEEGLFTIEIDGDKWKSASLKEAIEKARAAFRKQQVRISIPVTQLGRQLVKNNFRGESAIAAIDGYRHLVITGIHGRTGNTLVRFEDNGTTEQLAGYSSDGTLARRLNAEEIKQFQGLARAKSVATDAYDAFIESVEIGGSRGALREYVESEIQKKIDTPNEPDVDPGTADPRLAAGSPRRKRR